MNHISDADLQAFLDGELSAARHVLVTDHLDGCQSCMARLRSFQQLYARIESLPETVPDLSLVPGVLARLEPRRAISSVARWLLVAELALGAGSLVAALSWLDLTPPAWSSSLAVSLQAWFNPGDPAIWLRSLVTPIQLGISAVESLSASATAPLGAALPVTGWAVLLVGLLLAGLAANGLILTRAGQPRHEDRRSA